jgi:hypothetical protein
VQELFACSVKPGWSLVDSFVVAWNDHPSRRVRRLKRWFKEAWSKGLIMAVLIVVVAILIVWGNVSRR